MDSRCRLISGAFGVGVLALGVTLLASHVPPEATVPADDPVPTPKGYVCHRATKPIVIDGRLEDTWNATPWTDDFVDIEGDRKPPRYRTRVKMLWDDEALYIAAAIEEPHVGAILTQHDSYIFHYDNDFEVFLDPDADNHLYAELEMNALNTTWDLLLTKPYRNGGKAIDAWEIAGLRTAVHVEGTINDPSDTDRGWTIEIAWPWKGLRQIASCPVPPRDGDRWHINFSRVQLVRQFRAGRYRKVPDTAEENWVWSPQGVIDMHRPDRWGEVQFSSAPPGTVRFVPDPSRPARRLLQRIHDAQAEYFKKHGRWATTLAELGLKGLSGPGLRHPWLEVTSTHYEASVALSTTSGKLEHWHIDSTGRVWQN